MSTNFPNIFKIIKNSELSRKLVEQKCSSVCMSHIRVLHYCITLLLFFKQHICVTKDMGQCMVLCMFFSISRSCYPPWILKCIEIDTFVKNKQVFFLLVFKKKLYCHYFCFSINVFILFVYTFFVWRGGRFCFIFFQLKKNNFLYKKCDSTFCFTSLIVISLQKNSVTNMSLQNNQPY